MRFILLVRHSESADKQPEQSDFDRILTPRGRDSAEQLGIFLKQEKLVPKIIIASSAIRTKQTVELILKAIEVQQSPITYKQELYQGSDADYFNFISQIDASADISMMVGHNPSISSLIGLLTGQHFTALHPGQAALIELNSMEMSTSGKLVKLIGPFLK